MSHNCKLSLRCTPINNSLQAEAVSLISFTQKLADQEYFDVVLSYPFKNDDSLVLSADRTQLVRIELSSVNLSSGQFDTNLQGRLDDGRQVSISCHFELIDTIQNNEIILDISASNLPIQTKCFGCLSSLPLAFYVIQKADSISTVIFESSVSKVPESDPIWHPTARIPKKYLSPEFTVKVFYTLDESKTRRQEIGHVQINLQDLLSGKEFMYELEDCQNKAFIMIDRTQEVSSTKGQGF